MPIKIVNMDVPAHAKTVLLFIHRECLAPRRRQLYAERYGPIQREKERLRQKTYPIRVRAQLLRGGMRDRSKKRGFGFDKNYFTVKRLMDWLTNDPYCSCCGKELDCSFKHDGKKSNLSPSMDRFDSAFGYTTSNTFLLCWRCNNLKRDATSTKLRMIADWMDKKTLEAPSNE